MPIMQIVITLVIVGVLMWLVNRFIPMQSTIKRILNGLVTILVVVWLVNVFGLMHYVTDFHVRH
ncbi:MAG: Thivi_2564 family membrane protein [Acidobacteriaceae bacterium]